jgi:tRNA A64-2'-O-ribosylphosphate transferase
MWVTPDSYISAEDTIFEDFHPIICCTASRRVPGGEVSEGGYIQGSGDDTENWAHGLTPPIFWANAPLLLSVPESELPELIPKLVRSSSSLLIKPSNAITLVTPTSSLHVTDLKTVSSMSADRHNLIISLHPEVTPLKDIQTNPRTFAVSLGLNKLGSRNLRTALPSITSFVTENLTKHISNSNPESEPSIIIACTTGKDHSIGVALAILSLFFDNDGQICSPNESTNAGNAGPNINKKFIRQRLSWIMTALPDVNPSGATLQSVNSFLMQPPS